MGRDGGAGLIGREFKRTPMITNRKLLLWLVLSSGFIFAGCVNEREFRGVTANLKDDGTVISDDKPLKFKVSSSGNTIDAGNYMALWLPHEKCQVILFYPKLRPFPNYQYFEADIKTNHVHVRQFEEDWHGTNNLGTNFDLPAGHAAVWLVRGKRLHKSVLELDGSCPANAEPLFGKIKMLEARDFNIDAQLTNDDGTEISGTFQSYRTLWAPVGYPVAVFALMFGLANE
jgi:hypothetical protein